MNVMEIVSGAGLNGAIRHCLSVSTELALRGHHVTVVCREDSWIHSELVQRPVELANSDMHRWPLNEVRAMAKLAHGRDIEVIHTHMSGASLFGVLVSLVSGVPCVATAHAYNRQWHWPLNNRVIAVSESAKRYLRRSHLVSARRIDVIYNFADESFFSAVPSETRDLMRLAFGVGNYTPLIGYVGSVFVEKGIADLVRIFAQVSKSQPDARLLIVGEGPEDFKAALRAMASALGIGEKIIWTGRRLDIPGILAALDLFVLASPSEACPISSLEAMACGVPVIAWKVAGVAEVVEHCRTGILIPLGRWTAMAETIVSLLQDSDRRKAFGEAARECARTHFSPASQLPLIEAALYRASQHPRITW